MKTACLLKEPTHKEKPRSFVVAYARESSPRAKWFDWKPASKSARDISTAGVITAAAMVSLGKGGYVRSK